MISTAKLYRLSLIAIILAILNSPVSAEPPVIKLVSQNLNQFYDDKDDGNKAKTLSTGKYRQRVQQLVEKIRSVYNFADVIAFQEVENIGILQDVSNQLKQRYNVKYRPVLIEGNDISGIDTGFLVKQKYKLKSISSLYQNKIINPKGEPLYSRPPLLIELCHPECFTIVNIHLRSMRGLSSNKKRKRVSHKRLLQAEILARWINKFQYENPQSRLMIVGDFNALKPSDAYVDCLGTLIGKPDQQRPKWKSPDLIKNDLVDTSIMVKTGTPYSYQYRKRKQLLDYLLVSRDLKKKIKSISYTGIDYKFSDHAAMIAVIELD